MMISGARMMPRGAHRPAQTSESHMTSKCLLTVELNWTGWQFTFEKPFKYRKKEQRNVIDSLTTFVQIGIRGHTMEEAGWNSEAVDNAWLQRVLEED